jgi:hypothetical protein
MLLMMRRSNCVGQSRPAGERRVVRVLMVEHGEANAVEVIAKSKQFLFSR